MRNRKKSLYTANEVVARQKLKDCILVKEEKNLQGLMSLDSFKKLRSEKLNKNKEDSDDIADLKVVRVEAIQNKEEEFLKFGSQIF